MVVQADSRKTVLVVIAVLVLLGVGWVLFPGSNGAPQLPEAEVRPVHRFAFLRGSEASARESIDETEAVVPADREMAGIDTATDTLGTASFSGRLVEPNGDPVAGAIVAVKPLWSVNNSGSLRESKMALQKGQTGAAGRFSFQLPRKWYPDEFVYCTIARADQGRTWVQGQFAVNVEHLFAVPEESEWGVGGRVTARHLEGRSLNLSLFTPWATEVVTPGSRIMLVAQATTDAATGAVDLVGIVNPLLRGTEPLTLFVSNDANDPVARLEFDGISDLAMALAQGIVVESFPHAISLGAPAGLPALREARLRFREPSGFITAPRWESVPGNRMWTRVLASGTFRVQGRAEAGMEFTGLLENGRVRWSFATPFPETLVVRVKDPEGRPIRGLSVSCRCVGADPESRVVDPVHFAEGSTDENGIARLNVPAGECEIRVQGSGDATARFATATRAIRIPSGVQDFVLEASTALMVGVRYAPPKVRSDPITVLLANMDKATLAQRHVLGYPIGSNVIRGLAWGRYRVFAFGDGYECDSTLVIDDAAEVQHVELQLSRAHFVTGQVMRESGEAVEGARVTVLGRDWPDGSVEGPAWRRATTDGQGRFEVGLGSGCTSIAVDVPGETRLVVAVTGDTVDVVLR